MVVGQEPMKTLPEPYGAKEAARNNQSGENRVHAGLLYGLDGPSRACDGHSRVGRVAGGRTKVTVRAKAEEFNVADALKVLWHSIRMKMPDPCPPLNP